MNRRTLKIEIFCAHPLPTSPLQRDDRETLVREHRQVLEVPWAGSCPHEMMYTTYTKSRWNILYLKHGCNQRSNTRLCVFLCLEPLDFTHISPHQADRWGMDKNESSRDDPGSSRFPLSPVSMPAFQQAPLFQGRCNLFFPDQDTSTNIFRINFLNIPKDPTHPSKVPGQGSGTSWRHSWVSKGVRGTERTFLGPATTQSLVVKFDGEVCGGVLVEDASGDFPSKRSSKISFQTSLEVRHQFRRKLRQLHSGAGAYFSTPSLRVEDPHPTGRSPDPKKVAVHSEKAMMCQKKNSCKRLLSFRPKKRGK